MAATTYLLDTNILVFLLRYLKSQYCGTEQQQKARRVLARVRENTDAGVPVFVSAVTVSELEFGAAKSRNPSRERRALSKALAPFATVPYDTVRAPRAYGEIRAYLENTGTPIGAMDLMIAAHAHALGAALVTNNRREFDRVPALTCEDWTE